MPPRSPAAHPELLENALLEALGDGMPAGAVERLGRLLDAHIGPVSRGVVEAEAGLARSRQTDVATFRGSFFTFLGRDYLPALERAILAAAPLPRLDDGGADGAAPALDPAGEARSLNPAGEARSLNPAGEARSLNVVEAAELLVLLTRLLDRRGIASTVVPSIGDAIMRTVGAFGTALAVALDGPAPPELGRLTRELGKLEILRWLLDVLGTADYHAVVSTQLQVCARRALRRATATLDRFLAERAADARRATAAVTAEIEDLVTLVLLLLDTEREAAVAEADNPFFREWSREEVGGFARRATALAALMFDELDALAAADAGTAALAPPLRQVMTLASFATRLDGYVSLPEITTLLTTIVQRRAALERRTR
jgi:hypothetical protein